MADRIDSAATREQAHAEMTRLLHAGDPRAAVAYAEGLQATEGWEWARYELLAVALIDGGAQATSAAAVEQGIEMLRVLFERPPAMTRYNIANGELALWEIASRPDQYVTALAESRSHLHAARNAFAEVAADPGAPTDLRVRALVNLGNAFDILGRDLEALEAWHQAVALDPGFGMAHGNIGVGLAGVAPFAGEHMPAIQAEAARALDRALSDESRVLDVGGPQALGHFRERRAELPDPVSHLPNEMWRKPHLRWCRDQQLFLHVSPRCQAETDERLDLSSSAACTPGSRITSAPESRSCATRSTC